MTAPVFHDHFSGHAALYARVRPRYPRELYAWLAEHAPHRRLAWDAGTGNGQAAVALAGHFDRVVATDASERQIAQAEAHPGVEYLVGPAERSPVPAATAALVTVAQAVHWFDLDGFYAAVREALVPGGIVALWCYDRLFVDPAVDRVIRHLSQEVVGPYWPPERAVVEEGYRTLPFPFERIDPPELAMTAEWDIAELTGYVRSWSAAQRYQAETGLDLLADAGGELTRAWGDPARTRTVTFELFVLAGVHRP